MTAATTVDLVREVAAAHGAASLAAADHIAVSFSSGGLAFASKRQPDALARVEARLSPSRQQITVTGRTPRAWTVEIADSNELKARLARLRSGSRRVRWQPEDLGAFAAAAIWTYLTLPLLLERAERIHRPGDSGGLRRLRITMPPSMAGHGAVQTLHIGGDGLIRLAWFNFPTDVTRFRFPS